MDGADLTALAEIGHQLLSTKLFSVSMYWMWIYDYFLTLGDEIEYAWPGKKSWMFALFIANRYIPALHVLYKGILIFDYTNCEDTRWELIMSTTVVLFLAQVVVALRAYAVTGKRKLLGGALCVLIAAQLCFGIYFIVLNGSSPLQPLPEINLDAYKVCLIEGWRGGTLAFTSMTIAFDLFTFLIILVTARGSGSATYPGIPSILGAILRDATVYFLVMFANQLVLFMFLFFAPAPIQLMPGVTQTMLLPTMASRLMLSLKKAASEPPELWSISTMGDFGRGGSIGDGTLQFGSRTFDASHEISGTVPPPDEEGIELDSVPRLSQDRGSRQPC